MRAIPINWIWWDARCKEKFNKGWHLLSSSLFLTSWLEIIFKCMLVVTAEYNEIWKGKDLRFLFFLFRFFHYLRTRRIKRCLNLMLDQREKSLESFQNNSQYAPQFQTINCVLSRIFFLCGVMNYIEACIAF